MYQFRDPIHGFIDVSEDELKIINSAPFQRLRHIRQLATTYLVYHGAEHTRFGHSLGVMHLASRVFDSIMEKKPLLFSNDKEENRKLCLWYRQILRLIGLTHDLGHAPFSHASEELFEDNKQHEDYTKQILFETEVSGLIKEIGKNFQNEHGPKYEITPELIWMIYEGKDFWNEKSIMPDFMFLHEFMDGELDCDKMDYLLRDSYYCGVTYGKYDLNRFVSTLTAYKKTKNTPVLKIAIERGGVQALEEFVLARYFMFIQVYFHKTRRYLDKLLVQSLGKILPNGKYPKDLSEYLSWDDNKVLSKISSSQKQIVRDFKNRKVLSCVYESQPHSEKTNKPLIKLIYESLKSKYGNKVAMDSVDKDAHKLLPSLVSQNDDTGKEIMIFDPMRETVTNIMEESLILNSLIPSISIQRLYADKSVSSVVQAEITKKLEEGKK